MKDINNPQDKDLQKDLPPSNGEETLVPSNLDDESVENVSEESSSIYLIDENGEIYYTSEWLKENTVIHGWLTFFLVTLGLGGLLSAGVSILTLKPEEYAGNIFLMGSEIIVGLSLLGISFYTIYAFLTRKPNAVFWGRMYVLLIFVTNLISLMIGEFDDHGFNTLQQVLRGISWSVIWFLYLQFSDQVEETIPTSFRTISKKDWGTCATIVLVPILCFVIGYVQINNIVRNREESEAAIMSVAISDNERTDGRIIFSVPNSFSCSESKQNVENGVEVKYFNLDNENIGTCTICSDYDDDISLDNFDSYRSNWKDPDTAFKIETDIDHGKKEINGSTCLYKIVAYKLEGVDVYWRFYLLFNEPTGKVALVSAYDANQESDYIDGLIESIRFK